MFIIVCGNQLFLKSNHICIYVYGTVAYKQNVIFIIKNFLSYPRKQKFYVEPFSHEKPTVNFVIVTGFFLISQPVSSGLIQLNNITKYQ